MGAIGVNCKTSLLVCASPAADHAQETLCSLEFASRAMQIEVNARVNRLVEFEANDLLLQGPVADEVQNARVDELAQAHQAVAEAVARAEDAEVRAALAEDAMVEATARAEKAEA